MKTFLRIDYWLLTFGFWLFLSSSQLFGQGDGVMPRLVEGDVNGLVIVDEEIYWGTAVFDHIAGKRDIYSKLHFDSLMVQNIILDQEKYQIGVFKLKSSEEAFEVYEMNKAECREEEHTGPTLCVSTHRVLKQTDYYLISITNKSGAEMAIWVSLQLSKILDDKIKKNTLPENPRSD